MTSTPLTLAALASAGVPGLFPIAADEYEPDHPDYASAVVLDSARQRWIVRSPLNQEASVRLESEHVILHSFSPGLRARLPFQLPTVVGSADSDGLKTFVYPEVRGEVVDIEELARRAHVVAPDRDPLAAQVGKALAVIHSLPVDLVQEADLPTYTAEQCRRRMLSELDRAAGTRRVSSPLLRRWEAWLEDDAMWDFRPVVVHGDLSEENLVLDGTRLSAIRGWSDLQVADPAIDFAWLMACPDQEFADAVVEVYSVRMSQAPDDFLLRRAYLHAEFALAQWLVRAVEEDDSATIREAEDLLRTLEDDLRDSGALKASERRSSSGTSAEDTARSSRSAESTRPDSASASDGESGSARGGSSGTGSTAAGS